MKTNAIIRIILFSLAIVIMSGILAGALLFNHFSFDTDIQMDTIELTAFRSIDAANIRELEIEWANGSIILEPVAGTDQITVQESGESSDEIHTVWTVSEDSLYIGFSEEYLKIPSVGYHESITKNLVIQVPVAWYCEELSIDTASADVTIRNLTIDEVDFDGASGTFVFDNCTIRNLDIKSASGDVTYNGSLSCVDFSAMSATFLGTLYNAPSEIKMESISGDLNLHLPADCGFTIIQDSLSGNFSTDFETSMKDNHITHGDGNCRISISSMSGNISIMKHDSASETVSADVCTDPNCTDRTHNHQTNHNSATTHHSESEHH